MKSPEGSIGDYDLIEQIGEGSMGRVYLARRAGLPRDFALKLVQVPSGENASETLERTRREVLALAEFHHPHIIGLVDAFTVEPDQVVIVTELADGRPFDEAVVRMTPGAVMLAMRQVASALVEVHASEIIHRDIKPSNVLVSWPLSDQPHVHVIDFGITRYSGEPSNTAGFIGSPAYASPEQVGGGEVGPKTDIFSWGALGFFALTGVAPFEAETVIASLHKHSSWERPDLSAFAAQGFPAEFCDLIAWCLEPEVGDRPESMQVVLDRVDTLSGLSEVLRSDSFKAVRPASEAQETVPAVPVQTDSEATVDLAHKESDQRGPNIWIENGVPFYSKSEHAEPQYVDVGGATAVAAAITEHLIAFALTDGEVHLLNDDGSRRMLSVPCEVTQLSFRRGGLAIDCEDGRELELDLGTMEIGPR